MMTLRQATAADAPVLARIHVDSWQLAYRGIVPESHLAGFTAARREATFRAALAAGLEETYLAEADGHPLGILTIGASRDDDLNATRTGEIWGIYITPSHWRKGIGRALVAEAERLLGTRGYADMVLWVLDGNAEARRFYEAVGFVLDGAAKMVTLGEPLKAVRYRKVLDKTNTSA